MLKAKMVELLNEQINLEFYSSNLYLQMSAWCDVNGFPGASEFLEIHADEEMMHMKKIFNYVKETGSMPILGSIEYAQHDFEKLKDVFEETLNHERLITDKINALAKEAFELSDLSTFQFLQWFLAEQHEEEQLFSGILDKLNLLGNDGKGLYMFDKELQEMASTKTVDPVEA